MKIATIADIPDELANEWLQHLRDFDTRHPGCHFKMSAVTDMSTAAILRALQIEPPLAQIMVLPDD